MCRIDKTIRCTRGHSFDISKSGYVNLLPPGKESNAHTGDERAMVRARVNFLSKDYYSSISESLADVLAEYGDFSSDLTLCDMGCGEGSHTCRVATRLHDLTSCGVQAIGFDASKYAAECASKLSRSRLLMPKEGIGHPFEGSTQVYFIPANIFYLPTADASFDAAISMFAPVAGDEASRILKKGGILAVVSSGREHLIEMRNLIYKDVRLTDFVPETPHGFRVIGKRNHRRIINIESKEDIEALFMMTPFYYKTTAEGRANLLSRDNLSVTVDVNYMLFEVE